MEMCEVLTNLVEFHVKTRNERYSDCERFYVNEERVTEREFIDVEATLANVVAKTVKAVAEELLNMEVDVDFDPDVGDYLDVKDLEGNTLFSVRVATCNDFSGSNYYEASTTWRPLKDIIKDTIEAIKGYIASKQL